jgi:hypothetical protein
MARTQIKKEHQFLLIGEENETSIGLDHLQPLPEIMGKCDYGKKPIVSFVFKTKEDADAVNSFLKGKSRSRVLDGDGLITLLFHYGLLT